MAVVKLEGGTKAIVSPAEVREYLDAIGIEYEQWSHDQQLPEDASQDEILGAYSGPIEKLKERGGYTTADVIVMNPRTPGLDEMLAKFNKEHWHDEDEIRFTISGHGIFHIHPREGPVVTVEVSGGDLIRIPRMTRHWFNLCEDRQIKAIRLFQNKSGWTPYYTGSGVDDNFQPVCMGPTYFTPH